MEQRTKELETLLNEFFLLDGNNPKRSEMDSFLTSYKSQKDSYEHVKYYLTHTTNQYVIWFSLSILEEKACRSWGSLSPHDQSETKAFILELYLSNNKNMAQYIHTKLGQVIADIGRNDFHLNAQEYISSIIRLIRNPQTSLRGINLLQYISEEFITSKEVLAQNKKDQLRKLLLEQVPTIMEVLAAYLDQLFVQNAQKKLKHQNLLPFQVGSPDTNTYTCNFSVETKNLTKAVFDALLSYFSWIPLNELLTPSLLDILFKYLRLEKNSIPALVCLNEILSKNCVPKEFEDFLMRIFHQIYSLMTDIATNNNITQYSTDFIEKFTQFISLFVSNHLRRVENNPNFPITDFLGLLFQFSFLQQSIDAFNMCLEIWVTFLEYLLSQSNERAIPAPAKYTDGLILFQSELIKRVLFSYNSNFLSQLDDVEETDNDLETIDSQLNLFIKECVEAASKITELYPSKGLENLYPLFSQNVTSFFEKLDEMIKQGFMMDQNDQMSHLVKDVITILQLFGQLTHLFAASFVQTFTAANYIFQKLLDMCSFCSIHHTYKFGPEWEILQIQLLNTIRSFCYWLLEYGNQVRAAPAQQPDFDNNISKLISIIIPMFERGVPEKISVASGRLLMSLVVISKPLNLFAQMEGVISNTHNICSALPPAVQSIVYSAISSTILTPPSSVSLSQQWDARRPKYSPFIKGITSQYLEIPQIPGFIDNKLYANDEVIKRVQRVLRTITAIIKAVPDLSTAKGILHDAIQDTLQVTLALFRIYLNYPDVLESILDFFFSLFESLKTQVGVPFTQQTITTFLEILGGDNINQLLTSSNDTGNIIIKKLIEILTFVIQTYGHSFETLLSSIISFSMEKIYPVIINTTSPLKPIFFTLLYTILDNHWKHFFPSTNNNHHALMLGNTSNSNANTQQQLNSILMAFKAVFQQNDVNLFKQALEYFEKLNTKHKLYEKISLQEPIFGCSFVGVFFDVLISKTQSILAEEIVNTVYHFASINFYKFFNEFFAAYLTQKSLTVEQRTIIRSNFTEDKDHPTFNRNMNQFINDFSFYSYVNS
eukprot:gene6911-8036_t